MMHEIAQLSQPLLVRHSPHLSPLKHQLRPSQNNHSNPDPQNKFPLTVFFILMNFRTSSLSIVT